MTTTTANVSCPHCGAANVAGAAFCESCGKALPSAVPTGPRVVSADALPQSAVGQRLVSDELVKSQKSASTTLLVVSVLQTIGAAIVIVAVQALRRSNNVEFQVNSLMVVAQVGVAVLFWCLWFWSRSSPLPAAIVGLILYCTLVALNVFFAVSQMAANPDAPRRGFGGIGIGILDIIIIAVLAKGIQAGLKHKQLLNATAAPAAP